MQLLNANMVSLLVFFIMTFVSLVTANPVTERIAPYNDIPDATFIITHEGRDYTLQGMDGLETVGKEFCASLLTFRRTNNNGMFQEVLAFVPSTIHVNHSRS